MEQKIRKLPEPKTGIETEVYNTHVRAFGTGLNSSSAGNA